jgi:hypothetical protein
MEAIAQESTATATLSFASLPALGAELEGGIFAGVTTLPTGQHAAVILLPNKAQERMTWQQSMAWADEVGGQLPSRPVAALLYANAKAQFEPDWHWTNEEYGASYAWLCHFRNGAQSYRHKSYEGCARAVRLIHLAA